MCPKLVVVLVVEAFDGRLLDDPVHPLDMPIGPRVVRLCEPVLKGLPRCAPVSLVDQLRDRKFGG